MLERLVPRQENCIRFVSWKLCCLTVFSDRIENDLYRFGYKKVSKEIEICDSFYQDGKANRSFDLKYSVDAAGNFEEQNFREAWLSNH